MKILVLNSGSSSVKFQIIETDLERMNAHQDLTLAVGQVEKIGLSDSRLVLEVPIERPSRTIVRSWSTAPPSSGCCAFSRIPSTASSIRSMRSAPSVIGWSTGGEAFASSVLMTPEVVEQIEECSALAPLHNPANLRGYYAANAAMPDVPHIAVFDTAFHQTMPPHAYLYGIPFQLYKKHHLRKYGFHGTSHRFVAFRGCQILEWEREEKRLIYHPPRQRLFAGRRGSRRSIDTSMGFTRSRA